MCDKDSSVTNGVVTGKGNFYNQEIYINCLVRIVNIFIDTVWQYRAWLIFVTQPLPMY